ncbi:MAG: hypothetical protein DMF04_03630 [Verrucomicrobia bacterium]|nr:MAG: hypothetical protein DMF04_03630 [Verrucomicrobiota bacterium]
MKKRSTLLAPLRATTPSRARDQGVGDSVSESQTFFYIFDFGEEKSVLVTRHQSESDRRSQGTRVCSLRSKKISNNVVSLQSSVSRDEAKPFAATLILLFFAKKFFVRALARTE